jgi:TolA-binding protein
VSNRNSIERASDAKLRELLRDLGRGSEHHEAPDAARAERIAAGLDRRLERLVARRSRGRIVVAGSLATAACALIAVGLHRDATQSALTIARESPPAPTASGSSAAPSSPAVEVPPTPTGSSPLRLPRGRVVPSASALPLGPPASEPMSTLGKENQLFREAAEASRRGDVEGALALLDQLVVQYPGSPLEQTAQVRRLRLLAKAGRMAEARTEAQRYLQGHPTGFAVSEARALLAPDHSSSATPAVEPPSGEP